MYKQLSAAENRIRRKEKDKVELKLLKHTKKESSYFSKVISADVHRHNYFPGRTGLLMNFSRHL